MKEYEVIVAPTIFDERGCLSFVEVGKILDFNLKRAYWLYNIKKKRGGHAHKKLKQFIFCIHGAVDFILDNGKYKEVVTLDSPNKGLLISKPLWREINNFKNDACIVVLTSDLYDEDDYIRSYEEFIKFIG